MCSTYEGQICRSIHSCDFGVGQLSNLAARASHMMTPDRRVAVNIILQGMHVLASRPATCLLSDPNTTMATNQ
jgi:hypothetical protein